MGITGLWKIVEPTATEIPLECLEGKKLAIGKCALGRIWEKNRKKNFFSVNLQFFQTFLDE